MKNLFFNFLDNYVACAIGTFFIAMTAILFSRSIIETSIDVAIAANWLLAFLLTAFKVNGLAKLGQFFIFVANKNQQ